MRLKSYIPCLFCVLLLFYLGGCQKTQILGEYYLGDLYYQNPYNGYETLVFKSSEGTLITFTGTGRITTVYEQKISINSNDYYIQEKDYMSLEGSDGNYSMGIGLESFGGHYKDPANIGMGWRHYVLDTLGNLTANSHFTIPLNKHILEADQMFYDSLLISNKVYYNVFSDETNQYIGSGLPPDTSLAMPEFFYYNKTYGILKLDFNDGSTWELSHIENR